MHPCAADNCDAPVRDGVLMCRTDWAKVSRPTQQRVYRTQGDYQAFRDLRTAQAYREAVDAAVKEVGGRF